jgi:hypothetical protein
MIRDVVPADSARGDFARAAEAPATMPLLLIFASRARSATVARPQSGQNYIHFLFFGAPFEPALGDLKGIHPPVSLINDF